MPVADGIKHHDVFVAVGNRESIFIRAPTTRIDIADVGDSVSWSALMHARKDAILNLLSSEKAFQVVPEFREIFGACFGGVFRKFLVD